MEDQVHITAKGRHHASGEISCVLDETSKSLGLYGSREISERHRHRYEFNNEFRQVLTEKGMLLAGLSPDGHLVEVVGARPPLVCGMPIPSRIQEPPGPSSSPVLRLCKSGTDPYGSLTTICPPGSSGRRFHFKQVGGTFYDL